MLPQRKSPRLQGYDYAADGTYFITICTHQKDSHFGHIHEGQLTLSVYGHFAAAYWLLIPRYFPQVGLDSYVIMPNHMHGLLTLDQSTLPKEKRHPLGYIVGTYKAIVTREINRVSKAPMGTIWQGRFHDHIVRNEADLNRIREYVANNPALWDKDKFYCL
ncbi:MAG: transposase [Chloroflexi bacterium]|nr:transposase [Chloroflexota bacterium]